MKPLELPRARAAVRFLVGNFPGSPVAVTVAARFRIVLLLQ